MQKNGGTHLDVVISVAVNIANFIFIIRMVNNFSGCVISPIDCVTSFHAVYATSQRVTAFIAN